MTTNTPAAAEIEKWPGSGVKRNFWPLRNFWLIIVCRL